MKKYAILLFFTLKTIVIEAQTQSNVFQDVSSSNSFTLSDAKAIEKKPLLVGQSRFFNNDSLFKQGELVTKKRHFTTELGYRFDQIERALEVKLEGGKQLYIDEKTIVLFKLYFENHIAVFLPLTLPKEKKKTLVQVIYRTATMQLYRDVHKRINRVIESRHSTSEPDYRDDVMNDYHYFFRKSDKDDLVEIKIKAKSFINVLPEKRIQITKLFEEAEKKEALTVTKLCEILGKLDKEKD
jgi:hypothetical protein